MSERPIFESTGHAIEVLFSVTIRLSGLVVWLAISLLHVALLALVLLALWWTQTTPQDVGAAVRQALSTWPAAALGAAGVSALTLLGGYWWLLKRVFRALGRPLAGHLLRGVATR
jgi:hypothetical protein